MPPTPPAAVAAGFLAMGYPAGDGSHRSRRAMTTSMPETARRKPTEMNLRAAALLLTLFACSSLPALADDPTFKIDVKDGVITPLEMDVPANTRIRLEVTNSGTSPAEFESVQLKKEKVIAGGNTAVIVIRNLDPGTYDFFDEFHSDLPHAKVTAK